MLSAAVTPPLSRQVSLVSSAASLKNHLCHNNNNNITVNQKLSSQQPTINYRKTSCSRNKRRSASLPDLALKTHKDCICCSHICGRTKSHSADILQAPPQPVAVAVHCAPVERSSHNWPSKRNGQQNHSQRRSSNRMGSAITIMTPTSMSTDRDRTNGRRDPNDNNMNVRVPIVGYEVMEKRAKFTVNCAVLYTCLPNIVHPFSFVNTQVFKLRIEAPYTNDYWLVLRRYTDFVRLHNKLKPLKSSLNLPPKKMFGDNFAAIFLDKRMTDLQQYIDEIMSNNHLNRLDCVREFFCLDEPPMNMDALSECRVSVSIRIFPFQTVYTNLSFVGNNSSRYLNVKRKQLAN